MHSTLEKFVACLLEPQHAWLRDQVFSLVLKTVLAVSPCLAILGYHLTCPRERRRLHWDRISRHLWG